MQKVEFKVKVGEVENTYLVKMPDSKLRKTARELKTDYFRKNVFRDGILFSHQIQDKLKSKGLWSDEKEEEIKKISRSIEEKLRLLSKGKSELVPTKDKLREIIVNEIKPLRAKQIELLAERSQLDSLSLESEAQQLEIDYLISECTYEESGGDLGNKVFASLDDYKARADEPYAEEAGKKLAELIGLSDPNWWRTLKENELLIKHGFMNSEGKYIDKDKNLVDSNGKRINAEGFYLNEDNQPIDDFGNKIDEKGEVIGYSEFDE